MNPSNILFAGYAVLCIFSFGFYFATRRALPLGIMAVSFPCSIYALCTSGVWLPEIGIW